MATEILSLKIDSIAITTHAYIKTSGSELEITFSGTDTPYTLEYSVDGLTYNLIDDAVASSPYTWEITSGQYDDIFDGTDTNEVYLKITDNLAVDDTFGPVIFCKRSVSNVRPKVNDTYGGDYALPALTATNHGSAFKPHDIINVSWQEIYSSPTTLFNVYLKNGATEYKIGQVSKEITSLPWVMATFTNLDIFAPLQDSGDKIWYVIIRGDGVHASNIYDGSASQDPWAVREVNSDSYNGIDYRARLETHKRVAGEKAKLLDEFTAIAQFEAGEGVTIIQRDKQGRRVGPTGSADDGGFGDAIDYKKAYNLVIAIDPDNLPVQRPPRAIQDVITFTNIVTGWQGGAEYYGTMYYCDIDHNWGLGNSGHPLFVTGQTANSYHLEINHITDDDPYNYNGVTNETIPNWETIDDGKIRVYMVKKGGLYLNQLNKDVVNPTHMQPPYAFEFRLQEIIPYNPTI